MSDNHSDDHREIVQESALHGNSHEHDHEHGHEHDLSWERWQKQRLFVRGLKGVYGEVYKKLLAEPRVYKGRDFPFKGGARVFGKKIINPESAEVTQMIETHIDVYAPGSASQKHGHMNSAVFYILEGKGYDVHDNVRHNWEAGDVCIVANGCVHRHHNSDPARPARVLVMKAKPLFLFAHMIYQKIVEYPDQEPLPGFEDFKPE